MSMYVSDFDIVETVSFPLGRGMPHLHLIWGSFCMPPPLHVVIPLTVIRTPELVILHVY
jgi:hypothetical protein